MAPTLECQKPEGIIFISEVFEASCRQVNAPRDVVMRTYSARVQMPDWPHGKASQDDEPTWTKVRKPMLLIRLTAQHHI